jgi:biopolymer transport protein ExbD
MKRNEFLKLSGFGLAALMVAPLTLTSKSSSSLPKGHITGDEFHLMIDNGEHVINKTIHVKNDIVIEGCKNTVVQNNEFIMEKKFWSQKAPAIRMNGDGTVKFQYNYIHS